MHILRWTLKNTFPQLVYVVYQTGRSTLCGMKYSITHSLITSPTLERAGSSRMKTVYIAHPISGDIDFNMSRVFQICEEIHRCNQQSQKKIVPVAPYLTSLQYLQDDVWEEHELGVEANHECFRRKFIDELWLYGDHISDGMREEVLLARRYDIPVIPKTEATRRELEDILD